MKKNICDFRCSFLAAVVISLVLCIICSAFAVSIFHGNELYVSAASYGTLENVIILDAGHGGEDCGAIGENGVFEKDINLAVTEFMGEELEKLGYAVIYTRREDRLLYKDEENVKGLRKISDLKNRCAIANSYPEAVFVSIHMNSFGDSRYSGLQVYYSERNEESRFLAEAIQTTVKERLQTTNERRTKAGRDIYVLENVDNRAVLVECGFLSNKDECEKLSKKEYQKQLSFLIVCAIIEYIEKNTV